MAEWGRGEGWDAQSSGINAPSLRGPWRSSRAGAPSSCTVDAPYRHSHPGRGAFMVVPMGLSHPECTTTP